MSTEKEKKNLFKEFGLSSFSVDNKTTVYVLLFIIGVMGMISYMNMPRESFPEIKQPTIYIGTPYPGNSPAEMEDLVTRPIEKEIKTLKNVKKFTSTSIQDYSTIVVEFESNIDPKVALQDVKDKVDKAKSELPNDLPADPNCFELDFSEFPVMTVNLVGDYGYDELKKNAEYLQDELEKIPQVSEAAIRGLVEKEVEISVDLPKMESMEISFQDIETAIANENIKLSAGEIYSSTQLGGARRTIRIDGEAKDPLEFENIIVKDENQRIVYLRDIATVRFGPVEPTSYARLDGKPVVMLDIKKKSGENLIEGAKGVRRVIAEAQANVFPKGLRVVITGDQSKQTNSMVVSLENNIIAGVILVIGVLLFFLGMRNSLFVGVAIPVSMIMGILLLSMMGATLNMMVLFSLILALGMLVDNGIVVVENVYRLHSEGMDKERASKYGVGEVAWPIIASTATTVAAFLPLLFWNDLMGEFMKFLPLTLIMTLGASLFVGLVVNPVLTAQFIKLEHEGQRSGSPKRFWIITAILFVLGILFLFTVRWLGSLLLFFAFFNPLSRFVIKPLADRFQYRTMVKVENGYRRFLQLILKGKRPVFLFLGLLLMMVVTMMVYFGSNPKVLFFPENEPLYVNVYVETPLGTDITETDALTRRLESKVRKAVEPNKNVVEAIVAQVGEGTADPNEGPSMGSSPNKARITVSFLAYEDRIDFSDVSTNKILEDIRESVKGETQAIITVEKNRDGPPVGKAIQLEVAGKDYDTLVKTTENILKFLNASNIPGPDKLKMDLETGKPEIILHVNKDAARRYGVSTGQIGMAMRTALFGKEISKFKEGEDDYEIQLRLAKQYRYDIQSLMNMRITFRNMTSGQIVQVPINAVAGMEDASSYGAVKRKDMDRVLTISSDVKQGYNANQIVAEYKELMAEYKMPAGYTYKFSGEQEEQDKSSQFLMMALIVAVFLIFLIIVAQFNSITAPLIIMSSVLFSTIGVFLGLFLFRMDFVILMCGIGIISLAGVVVNNAIVLIDYTNVLRERKREELGLGKNDPLPMSELMQSIVDAGATRLRPVLLTAITTVLGLVPLAIGLNIDFIGLLNNGNPDIYMGGDNALFWGPMSWTVIFGLTFATFLTLVAVPAMYLINDKLNARVRKWTGKKKEADS
ncbi:MAG: efflux RND transporter permease subunit [Bacteroidia bacterium]|nr:efflux RND transporter permease subunit [Bacteroidia bacterium]